MTTVSVFIKKKRITEILFCLSLVTTGIIINGLGILSPAYISIIFVLCFLTLFCNSLKSKYLISNQIFLVCASWFFLEIFINPTGDRKTGLFYIVTLLSYPFFDLFCKKINKKHLISYSVFYIHFVISLYFFELLIRMIRCNFTFSSFANPLFFVRLFYLYKENLIIGGGDTNFIATHLLIVFFFAFYLKRRFFLKLEKDLLLLAFLLFFTFSRASWIALIFGIIILPFIHRKARNKISEFRLLTMLAVIFVALTILLSALLYDGSFQTKVAIMDLTMDFLNNASLRDLFLGLGFLNSIQVIKFNVAHTLISTLIMDTGVISLLLYFLCWIPILRQSRGFGLYVLIPVFIFSLSFIQQMIPYLYITLAIISNLEQKNVVDNSSCL